LRRFFPGDAPSGALESIFSDHDIHVTWTGRGRAPLSRHGHFRDDALGTAPDRFDALEHALAERDAELERLRRELDESRRRLDEVSHLASEVQARFAEVWAATPVGLALANERGEYVAVNDALCRLLDRDEADIIGRTSIPFTHPDDVHVRSISQQLIRESGGRGAEIEKRYVRPSGEVRWAQVTMTHLAGPDRAEWTLACVDDITERRQAERTLQDSEQNLSAVARVTRRIQSGEDARSTIIETVHEMTGAQSAYLVEPLDDDRLVVTATSGSGIEGTTIPCDSRTAIAEALRTGRAMFLEDPVGSSVVTPAALAAHLGSIMWQPVFRNDRTIAVIVVKWPYRIDDVPERSARVLELLADETSVALAQDEMRAELQSLARTDPLTALPNRRAWDDQLAVLGEVALVTGQPLVVAMIDLDHFKSFNDRYGHGAGDDHLREFAIRARASLRDSDLLTRWGGEEFAAALPNCAETEAISILDQVRYSVPGDQTCSIGWATWDGAESTDHLLDRVDAALYRAKEAGRNCLVEADRGSASRTA
jgi:diguanylate cyclase (GGDEF)-like protein/PAS domain S-box-containing protein